MTALFKPIGMNVISLLSVINEHGTRLSFIPVPKNFSVLMFSGSPIVCAEPGFSQLSHSR